MWEKCKELQEELVRMRRELHQIPELGGELPKTRAYVEEKLKELGIPFVENKTDSGLIATIKGEKEGKTIVLRADMDALPIQEANEVDYISRHEGCMHACGHDTHMTMLLGAAKILSEHKNQIPGTVRLLFQTDEEGSRGAQRLCAEGAMDGVDAVFGTHIGTIISKDIKAGTVISVRPYTMRPGNDNGGLYPLPNFSKRNRLPRLHSGKRRGPGKHCSPYHHQSPGDHCP